MNLSCEDDLQAWMEDPLQLSMAFGETADQFPNPIVVEDCSFKGLQQAPLTFVIETKKIFEDCQYAGSVGSPDAYTEEDIDEDAWEEEFSMITSSDREAPEVPDREVPDSSVPVLDVNIQKELVELPVKEFNIKIKSLKLDNRVLQHLKLCRKRLKNRQAAIRSRSKKETETSFLRNKVDELTREKEKQNQVILQLQKRLTELEKKSNLSS